MSLYKAAQPGPTEQGTWEHKAAPTPRAGRGRALQRRYPSTEFYSSLCNSPGDAEEHT